MALSGNTDDPLKCEDDPLSLGNTAVFVKCEGVNILSGNSDTPELENAGNTAETPEYEGCASGSGNSGEISICKEEIDPLSDPLSTTGNTAGTKRVETPIEGDGNTVRKEVRFECVECDRTFKLKHHLKRHVQTHTNRRFKCECGKIFASNISLTNHRRTHKHPDNLNCEKCGKTFVTRHRLAQHMQTHTKRLCHICGASISTVNINNHIQMHSDVRAYKCECGKDFKRQTDLDRHALTHLNIKNFECEVCGKKFTRNSHLMLHRGTHDAASRKFECLECGKCFITRGNLKHHTLTHSGDRSHKCEECGLGFIKANDLARHILTHTGARNFKCSQCGRKYTRASTLTTHMATHHDSAKKDGATVPCEGGTGEESVWRKECPVEVLVEGP